MKTEAELKAAIDLMFQIPQHVMDPAEGTIRDASVEALRWALGIVDADSSPMTITFQDYLDGIQECLDKGAEMAE